MWIEVTKRASVDYFRHQNAFVAGTLAFSCLLAIFPFVIFLASLAGLYSDTFSVQQGVSYILAFMPERIESVFAPVIQEVVETQNGGLLTFGFLGTLYVLMAAVDTLRAGLNQAYQVTERRVWWKRWLHNFGTVCFMASLLLAVTVAIVLGPVMVDLAVYYAPPLYDYTAYMHIMRYVFGFFLLWFLLSATYNYLPNIHHSWRRSSPGALVATMLWIALASLFSLYLKYYDTYTVTYGSLAGIIIALVFLKASAMVFLFGAEINYAYWRVREQKMNEKSGVRGGE